jgi:hypothetical protein
MTYIPPAMLVFPMIFMVLYHARRLGLAFDDDYIRDKLLLTLGISFGRPVV